jgi:hypothetical protein
MATRQDVQGAQESSDKGVPQVVNELWSLTRDYARQETVDPLKGVGRYIIYGFAGAVLTSIGVILLLLSLLRALQTEDLTGSTFRGNLSWIPYVIVLIVGAAVGLLAFSRISRRRS